jgi:hypothetical protein
MPFPGKAPDRARLLSSLAALALLTAGTSAAALPASAATPGAAASVRSSHAVYAGSSTPATTAAAPSATATAHRHQLPVLRRPRPGGVSPNATTTSPRTTSSPLAAASLVHAFDGVNVLDNKRATGFDLEPPDEGLASGNGYVVNFVNVTGLIQSTSGARLVRPFYLNPFFHETAAANTSDPRVFYDSATHRWFATILEYAFTDSGTMSESHVDVATSRTGDPRGSWAVYKFDTTNRDHAGCPCLADYPILGVDGSNIYISTNEFTADLASFNGAQLYAIAKSQLVAGSTAPRMAVYENLSSAGVLGYHVQPANTYGSPGVEYLMSSLDPNGTFDNRIAVWALTNPSSVASGGTPNLSVRVISSEGYALPPNAQTPAGTCTGSICGRGGDPTTGVVSANDDAMQEVQYINGVLVGALDTSVNVAGDAGARAGVAWFVVKPAVSGGAIASGTHVTRQGYIAQQGEYLLFPHINMTPNGAMAVVFGHGGPASYLSAAYATAKPGAGFGAVHLAGAGVAPDNGFTATDPFGGVGRWGDYSNGQIVPGTNQVWLATQYIPDNGDVNANWGNRIFELNLG